MDNLLQTHKETHNKSSLGLKEIEAQLHAGFAFDLEDSTTLIYHRYTDANTGTSGSSLSEAKRVALSSPQ